MAGAVLHSSNGRVVAAIVVLGFIVLEVAVGGRALGAVVQQAVLAQSTATHVLIH